MYIQMGGWCLTTGGAKVPVYMVVVVVVVVAVVVVAFAMAVAWMMNYIPYWNGGWTYGCCSSSSGMTYWIDSFWT